MNEEIEKVKRRLGIIGDTPELNEAIAKAIKAAPYDTSVLVLGETGVGKESFSHIFHEYNKRRNTGKFIAVNCGAIPVGTIEAELFGSEKGAYTDAKEMRIGYFEAADKGTIFLDEIGNLPIETQQKILRVIESGEYTRVGSSNTLKTDVRIVAATNANLMRMVERGQFRSDLYFRLNGINIMLPPLRKRANDIEKLFIKFSSDFSTKYSIPMMLLGEGTLEAMQAYAWPGNIRQLKQLVERVLILEETRTLTPEIFHKNIDTEVGNKGDIVLSSAADTMHNQYEYEHDVLLKMIHQMHLELEFLQKQVVELQQKVGLVQEESGDVAVKTPLALSMTEQTDASNALVPVVTHITAQSIPSSNPEEIPEEIEAEDVTNTLPESTSEDLSMENLERLQYQKALDACNGNRKQAAKRLGISDRTLYRRVKKYGLQ